MVSQQSDKLFFINQGSPNSLAVQLYARDASYAPNQPPIHDFYQHVKWGAGDNQPNVMRLIVEKNAIVRALLESLRDMIHGAGLSFVQRTYQGNQPVLTPYADARLDDWCEATDLKHYFISAINQRVDSANIFTRWEYDPRQDWFLLSTVDTFLTRIGKDGTFHLNPFFGSTGYYPLADTARIPRMNPHDRDFNVGHTVTMSHSREAADGQPYYAFPSWWCAKENIDLANLVSSFHKSGISNGYNIKYLIKMPQDYFDKEGNRSLDSAAVREKWSRWSANLSSWMAGKDNVNKSLIIKYLRGTDGKMLDNVDVVPLKNEMSDDAYDKVWEQANKSIANSIGILPTLAGVNPGKGNDSGSQIRVMADYQQHFRTPIHRVYCLREINRALRMMGYTDVFATVNDVQITTLDVAPQGIQEIKGQESAS